MVLLDVTKEFGDGDLAFVVFDGEGAIEGVELGGGDAGDTREGGEEDVGFPGGISFIEQKDGCAGVLHPGHRGVWIPAVDLRVMGEPRE